MNVNSVDLHAARALTPLSLTPKASSACDIDLSRAGHQPMSNKDAAV